TDNADIPTIFEYVLGILWYKASERKGKILDYMKLSLDADLLPKTHAAGGEADIVYEYESTEYYPEHTLLLEATLADGTNQRRMEMEPVSRHLGQHLIRTGNMNSYCVFATNYLNINVIADFRGRKNMPYYDPNDYEKFVDGMKIIPLQTSELKSIISKNIKYKDLYGVFDEAYKSELKPHEWYEICINNEIIEVGECVE
ncbi:MAG: AlwI family type II restriction endonuclease, partial [Clostridiales bacterium]|nr:AlwI family type II restriction endonuclease [Clostridiales bacterium]